MNDSAQTVRWPVKVWWWTHVVLITLWCFPNAPPAVSSGRASGNVVDNLLLANDRLVRDGLPHYYIEPLGLWQYWDMFAPDPMQSDFYFEAVMQFQDGTIKSVEFPRIVKMPLLARYTKERFRKYGERVRESEYQYLWPTWAQWMATQASTDPSNPVIALNLQKKSRNVPPPTANLDMNRPFETTMFHPQMVDLPRLYREKGWAR